MYKLTFLIISLTFSISSVFSQNKINLSGIIRSEDNLLSEKVIELKINEKSRFSISNDNGNYKFTSINCLLNDTLTILVKSIGFKDYKKILIADKEDIIYDIQLEKNNIVLEEVIIKGKENVISNAKKDSYKIDQKQFIKNSKATQVLNTIPNVYYNENNSGAIVDGNITAIIFLDGIQLQGNELKTLVIDDIERVEVINNPSQSYGSEFTGAVINLISKKKIQKFLKGSISASKSLRLNNWYLEPSVNFKSGFFSIKSSFGYLVNNQFIEYDLTRTSGNDSFVQKNSNDAKGVQKSSETRINFKFSEKSDLSISNLFFGYKFIDNINGFSKLNDDSLVFFQNTGENGNVNWNINSVYTYRFNDNKRFFFKSKYLAFQNFNRSSIAFSQGNSEAFNIESTNDDLSFAINYEAEEIKVLNTKAGFYSGMKFINRNFGFSNTDFSVRQNILNLYLELDFEFLDKFSSEFSFAYEHTNNSNDLNLNQNYNYFLPTINLMYKFSKTFNSKIGFSKKVLRPNANDLNDELIIYNLGQATQGNSNLLPQIRDYYFFSLNKKIKKDNVSFKLYNERINNAIADTYRLDSDLLIQTLNNASKFFAYGINLGYRTKLFKKISTNLNTGIDYSVYEDKTSTALLQKTEGYTFRGSLNLETNIFKDKVSISFSANQKSPTYSLLSKNINYPFIDFEVSTNMFKDKISINLNASNVFGFATKMKSITSYSDFYQLSTTTNNISNLTLSLSYNFGKIFDDNIIDSDINNNDIR